MFFGLFKNIKPYKNLNSDEFKEAVRIDKSSVLIDVRTPAEFKGGKIKGARNIDVNTVSFRNVIKNLPKDKNYYVYCRSGGRSGTACTMMAKEGFKNLFNLSGGIMSWNGELVK
jgi:rhodanese-related sulfurtransferase